MDEPSPHEKRLIHAARKDARATPAAEPAPRHRRQRPHLPGYDVVDEIHRGAQGIVFLATQHSTERIVAIKMVRRGAHADGRERARFEREVRVLAALNHPNIVTIHDSGETDDDLFLVMDYVEGETLDAWIEDEDRTVERTLDLFARICDGVSAAHLRGVIHRDLKPSNILIDVDEAPRILDFGLAKLDDADAWSAAGSDDGLATVTMSGQFIGSLPWASPEQAGGETDDVDLRSDVYALGVILYQLLTGRFPYSVAGPMREVLEHIIATEPERPSTFRGELDDDVETIVLKCLSKNPERRYQSAGELAQDVRNYLGGDPIVAKRDSAWYVLRKTVTRHRVAFAAAAAFFTVVTAAAIALGVMYARQSELLADLQFERDEANRQYRIARAVDGFLNEDLLAAADPEHTRGERVTVNEVIDLAAETLEGRFVDPLIEAGVRRTIGSAYTALGRYADAAPQLERALEMQEAELGSNHLEVAATKSSLATLLGARGEYARAETMHRDALAAQTALLGDDDPALAATLTALAATLADRGDYDAAADASNRAVEIRRRHLGADHVLTAESLTHLAVVHDIAGEYDDAERMHREALDIRRRAYDAEHPVIANSLYNVAGVLVDRGDYTEAEPYARDALAMYLVTYAPDHPVVLPVRMRLAAVLLERGQYEESAALYDESVVIAREQLGADHPTLAVALHDRAEILWHQGSFADAEPLYREALSIQRAAYDGPHPALAATLSDLGSLRQYRGDYEEASSLLHEGLAMRRAIFGDHHIDIAESLNNIAYLYLRRREYLEAEPLVAEVVEIMRVVAKPGHGDLGIVLHNYGRTLTGLGRYEQAETTLFEARDVLVNAVGEAHKETWGVNAALRDLYRAWERPDDAAEWAARVPPRPKTVQP